jgi:hypothetical protein
LATDYYALEDLKTALVTFDNANMDLELITSTELWMSLRSDAASTASRMFIFGSFCHFY